MKLHSDKLTRTDFAFAVLTAPGTFLADLHACGSRSRVQGWELRVESNGTPDADGTSRRRRPMHRSEGYAASYADWGRVLAYLFAVDADLIAGPYKGRDDFDSQTRYAFDVPVLAPR